jgi:hypothetical protein
MRSVLIVVILCVVSSVAQAVAFKSPVLNFNASETNLSSGVVEGDLPMATFLSPQDIDALLQHLGLAEAVAVQYNDFQSATKEEQAHLYQERFAWPLFQPVPRYYGVTCFYTDGWMTFWGNGVDGISADITASNICRWNSRMPRACRPISAGWCFLNWGY